MAEKIQGYQFAIDLDDGGMAHSLKTIRDEAKALKNAMQSNFTEVKSGEGAMAAYSQKVIDAGRAIDAQRAVIEKLEAEQNGLHNSTKSGTQQWKEYDTQISSVKSKIETYESSINSLKSKQASLDTSVVDGKNKFDLYQKAIENAEQAMSADKAKVVILEEEQQKLNQSTEKSRQAYLKYESQIDSAKRTIANLQAQQERARASYDLEKSSVLQLKEATQLAEKVNNSYSDSLKAQGKSLEAQKAKLTGLADVRAKMRTQLEAEKSRLAELGTQYDSSSKKYQEQETRVNELTTKYAQNKNEIKELNSAVGGMSDRTIKVKETVSNATDKIKEGFDKVKNSAIVAGGGIAILGAAALSGAKKASTLQNEYKVTTNLLVTGGEEAAEATKNVAQMQKDGMEYSVKYGKSQAAIAEQYQELVKRGYSSKEALGAMRSELQASVASGDDFNDVVKVSSQVVDAFGMRTDNTAKMTANTKKTVNELAYAADMTATDFQSLGKGMEYVGDSAHSAGFKLSETSAAMGELSNHGLEADKAGTGLRKVVNSISGALSAQEVAQKGVSGAIDGYNEQISKHQRKINELNAAVKAGTKTQKSATSAIQTQKDAISDLSGKIQEAKSSSGGTSILDKLGIKRSELVDANGNMKDLSTIMKVINDRTKDMGTAKKNAVFNTLFGTTGQQAGIILAQNNKELSELTDKVQKAGDKGQYVATLAEKNSQTAQQSEARFKQAWSNLTIMFGSKLLPYMTDAANNLSKMFNDPQTIKGIESAATDVAKVAGGILKVGEYAAEHAKQLAGFATALASVWAINKVATFIRSMQTLKSVLGNNLSQTEAETTQVELQTKAYQELTAAKTEASAAGGIGSISSSGVGEAGNAASALTTNVEKSATKSSSWDLLGKSMASRIINGAGIAFSAWDIGSSVYKAGTSKNASNRYDATGKAVGGGIGLAAGAVLGGPMGAWIGEQIGSQLGSTKVGKSLANKLVEGLKTSMAEQQGVQVNVNAGVDKVKLSKNVQDTVKTINKTLQKANTLTVSMGVKTDASSLTKAYKTINAYYDSLGKLADKSAKKRTAAEKSFLQAELKNGDITKSQYNKLVDSLNKSDANRTKANKAAVNSLKQNNDVTYKQLIAQTKTHENNLSKISTDASKKKQKISKDEASAIASIQASGYVEIKGKVYYGENGIAQVKSLYAGKRKTIEKNSNKDIQKEDTSDANTRKNIIKSFSASRIAEEKKLGVDVAGELTSSSKKQKAILTELKNSKGKISEQEAQKLISESAKAANKQISDAQETYKSTKKSADDKANNAIANAEWMYKNVKGYSKSQETAAIDSAKNERDVTVAAAKTKRDQTEATARDQNKQVKDSASDESKSVSEHAVKSAKNGVWAWRQHVGGIYDVLDWIAKAWNTLVKDFGGESKMKGISTSYPAGQPNISMGAYATGSDTLRSAKNALVGEAGPEIAYKPYSGKARIVGAKGAEITMLEAGEKVLNASDTSKVLTGQFTGKLPAYASGTGSLTDFMSGIVNKAKSFTGNIAKTVQSLLDDPEKVVKNITKKITGGGKLGDLGDHLFSTVSSGIESMFVNAIKKIADNVLSGANNPSGSGVTRWKPYISKAAKAMKWDLSGSDMNTVLKRIQQESNGDPTVENDWDSNAKAGHPSIGLLQYIQPTLDYWVPKGVKPNIKNGYIQLLAGFNDSNFIRDISVSGGWGPTGHKRMANGGIVNQNQMIEVAEGNIPEAVVPWDLSKRSRAYQVMQESLDYFKGQDGVKSSSSINETASDTSDTQLKNMNDKFDSLLSMFGQLLGLNGAQLSAIKAGSDPTKLYQRMAKDQSAKNYQTFGG